MTAPTERQPAAAADRENGKIPVILVTGFLGAGKTSLLNRLLRSGALSRSGFIINEFGAVGVDSLLVETADENMAELNNGCLCCTVKGDLPDTVAALLAQSRSSTPLSRIIIETTGLANPAPIARALQDAAFLQDFICLGPALNVLDSANGAENLRRFAEARRQAAFADTIIFSKTDTEAGKAALPALRRQLQALSPAARYCAPPPETEAEVEAEAAFCHALLSESFPRPRQGSALGHQCGARSGACGHSSHNGHSGAISSFVLETQNALPLAAAERFAAALGERFGKRILRLKGLADSRADGADIWVLQAVQGRLSPPQRLPESGRGAARQRGSFMAVIAEGGGHEAEIRALWASCCNIPQIDGADRAAVFDNPLALPGMKF